MIQCPPSHGWGRIWGLPGDAGSGITIRARHNPQDVPGNRTLAGHEIFDPVRAARFSGRAISRKCRHPPAVAPRFAAVGKIGVAGMTKGTGIPPERKRARAASRTKGDIKGDARKGGRAPAAMAMDNGGRLSEQVRHSLETYFDNLDGCPAHDLYRLAMSQMERPLLDVVMKRSAGNLSRASLALGINRATLRKKLKKYGLLRAD